jgi:hypothetical protein
MKVDHHTMIPPVVMDRDGDVSVTLESYLDDHHGFMMLTVTPTTIVGDYYQVPRPQEPFSKGNQLVDHFEFDWRNRKYLINDLSGPATPLGKTAGKSGDPKKSGKPDKTKKGKKK